MRSLRGCASAASILPGRYAGELTSSSRTSGPLGIVVILRSVAGREQSLVEGVLR